MLDEILLQLSVSGSGTGGAVEIQLLKLLLHGEGGKGRRGGQIGGGAS